MFTLRTTKLDETSLRFRSMQSSKKLLATYYARHCHHHLRSSIRWSSTTTPPTDVNKANLASSASAAKAAQVDSPFKSATPLSKALPGLPLINYQSPSMEDKETTITRLSNGLTVASQNKFGMQCTVGVVINAGPRFEAGFKTGVSHFIEKLGFHSTAAFSGRNDLQSELEKCGAIFDCQIGRDIMIYALSGGLDKLPRLVNVLSEVVFSPKITEEEVTTASETIVHEVMSMFQMPPPDNILSELIHKAAFNGQSLGRARYCPTDDVSHVKRSDIMSYLATFFKPDRMVLCGVGIPHDELVMAAERSIIARQPTWEQEGVQPLDSQLIETRAQYTGGMATLVEDLAQYHSPMPEYAHIVIGLESCGMNDSGFVPSCLLNTLMGGGGSFSAGGPGKGMYSRLYLNLLNVDYWINSAQANNQAYEDTGVFAISASAPPQWIRSLSEVVCREMRKMAGKITTQELDRAKKQLQSMMLTNLEYRAVVFEDIARQVLSSGRRKQPDYWTDAIENVTKDDINSLVHRMLQSKPSVAGFGDLSQMPTYEEISQQLTSNEDKPKSIFNLLK